MTARSGASYLPAAPADCTHCGACCLSDSSAYIRVFEVDYQRMDERARALTRSHNGQRQMRFREGRCTALSIDVAAGTLKCSIHPQRPDACRWLEQHSHECRRQVRDKRPAALLLLRGRR